MIKNCLVCGKKFEFSKKNYANKYCSRKCYFVQKAKKKLKRNCLNCSKSFYTPLCKIQIGKGKYCSKVCFDIRWNTAIKKNCLECNKEFLAQPNVLLKDKGKYCSMECRAKMQQTAFQGNNGPGYIDGRTPLNTTIRHSWEHINWARQVKERDNYICQICGIKGGKLHSNHIKKFSDYSELRFEVNNGITLCKSCHVGWVNHHETEWESYFNFVLEVQELKMFSHTFFIA